MSRVSNATSERLKLQESTNNQQKKDNSVKHLQRQQFSFRKTSIKVSLINSEPLSVQYVVLGPRKSPMPLVRVFSENDKIFRQEKKYVE